MPCRFVPKPTFISLCRFFCPYSEFDIAPDSGNFPGRGAAVDRRGRTLRPPGTSLADIGLEVPRASFGYALPDGEILVSGLRQNRSSRSDLDVMCQYTLGHKS